MRSQLSLFVVLIALIWLCEPARADRASERQFAWQAANWRLASANVEADFLEAADSYRELIRAGVRNGPLFYNLGTALLNAGQYEEAFEALVRAERYMGTTWEIKRNMLVATAKKENTGTPSLPAYRLLFFWHYGLATMTRTAVALVAFACLWLALILRALGVRRGTKQLIIVAAVTFVLFGSSVGTSMYQESRAESIFNVHPSSKPVPAKDVKPVLWNGLF